MQLRASIPFSLLTSQQCRRFRVLGEERLDRQLGEGDVDRGAEDRGGAEKIERHLTQSQAEWNDHGAVHLIGRGAWILLDGIAAELVQQVSQHRIAAYLNLAA